MYLKEEQKNKRAPETSAKVDVYSMPTSINGTVELLETE